MAQRGRLYGCPVEFALDALGGKWKTVIIARIKQGPLRYSELRRLIPSLSDKMLTQRLADLVEIGFVALAALQALYDWGILHGRAEGVRFRTDIEAAA
ncbi:helix-turn-helix transcriptional regulator [Mesorhizobium sp. CA14]|uniref:winged helix-turn-helix transcriptional regulator n=1 Tax=Mesorhizobium sp. CA14 TaxID=2876642 RepID=UPI001CCDB064|nr:helix-turn-helix domain-containing protein [Mesorhizobium sp. CA14]MBZ9850969.1 helix-turn-helix transcriptional regulator [Mesorhizobium sp. CA14]